MTNLWRKKLSSVPVPTNDPTAAAVAQLDPIVATITARIMATGRYVGGAAFLMQALNAATIEEATNIGSVIQGAEHLGERIRFFDVQFLDSDPELDAMVPYFAVCDVVREMGDGTHEKLSTGAGHVLGVLIAACEQGWFPFDGELVSAPIGAGKKAINLSLAPRRVEPLEEL